jgi:hypothetical protein
VVVLDAEERVMVLRRPTLGELAEAAIGAGLDEPSGGGWPGLYRILFGEDSPVCRVE